MRLASCLIPLVLLLAAASCEFEPDLIAFPDVDAPAVSAPAASNFDPAKCGTITGRVTWDGPLPFAGPFIYGVPNMDGSFTVQMIPNPNRPAIDEKSRTVAGAVVFLRGVDPAAAKPWDHPPVRIEMKERGIVVVQGDVPRHVGFVRRGDAVAMISKEPIYHMLRARGAAFFSLAFPEPDQPLLRTFDKPGLVDFSSGAGVLLGPRRSLRRRSSVLCDR